MAKSFVNQNLCDRSFRGQDLTGADFTGANLSGCDFRESILVNANFSLVTTGESLRQKAILKLISAIAMSAFVIIFASIIDIYKNPLTDDGSTLVVDGYMFMGMFFLLFASIPIGAIVYAKVITVKDLFTAISEVFDKVIVNSLSIGMCIYLLIVAGLRGYIEFYQGNYWLGIIWSLGCIFFLYFIVAIIYCIIWGESRCTLGTQFQNANLTRAKFACAKLNSTNFLNIASDYVDWQGANFSYCKLPDILVNSKLRNFYTNPQMGRSQDFSNTSFERTYLADVDLVDSNLQYANLKYTDLRNAKLINSNLQYANLSSADFCGANLVNANLSNTQVLGTSFSRSNLTGSCIENWWINPNTKFDDVICEYIFLNQKLNENGQTIYDPNSRKPAIGNFQQGDFTKLIRQYLDSLDLIFRNGDDPKVFAFALQELLNNYPEAAIEFKSLDNLGDGDIALRLMVGNQSIQKSTLHSFFTQASNLAKSFFTKTDPNDTQQLQSQIKQLRQKLEAKDQHIEILESQLTPTKRTSSKDAKVGNNFSLISVIVQDSMFGNKKTDINASGDVSGVAVGNISGVAGKDQKGIAGRDINGQVTVTIQQLQNSDAPEAPQLVELLTQLQTTIAESPDLSDKDKQKALKYLDNIGEIANKKDGDRNRIDELIDNILGVASKAAKLLTPVQAIADSVRKLLQL